MSARRALAVLSLVAFGCTAPAAAGGEGAGPVAPAEPTYADRPLGWWVETLADPRAAAVATAALDVFTPAETERALVAALGHPNHAVAVAASKRLRERELVDPWTVRGLTTQLDHARDEARRALVDAALRDALRQEPDADAPTLVHLLERGYADAARSLARFGPAASVPASALRPLLASATAPRRGPSRGAVTENARAAMRLLPWAHDDGVADATATADLVAAAFAEVADDPDDDALVAATTLAPSDARVRAALRRLASAAPTSARDRRAVATAGWARAAAASPQAADALLGALRSDEPRLRTVAIRAASLAFAPWPDLVDAWAADLGHVDPAVRQAAAEALRRAGTDGARAVPAWAATLTAAPRAGRARHDEAEDEALRLEATAALAALGASAQAALPALEAAARADRSERVRDAARAAAEAIRAAASTPPTGTSR